MCVIRVGMNDVKASFNFPRFGTDIRKCSTKSERQEGKRKETEKFFCIYSAGCHSKPKIVCLVYAVVLTASYTVCVCACLRACVHVCACACVSSPSSLYPLVTGGQSNQTRPAPL